ncbi:hypothetical protein N9V15_02330, partial [Porticoccaceae bacterium]|nr:hypothetical protein [Porticoccaceae bacterium]
TQHLNKELFNSTMVAEVGDAIESFLSQKTYQTVFLAGFSLGGQFYPAHCSRSGSKSGPEGGSSYFTPGGSSQCYEHFE